LMLSDLSFRKSSSWNIICFRLHPFFSCPIDNSLLSVPVVI
jgi:hypothetical protein